MAGIKQIGSATGIKKYKPKRKSAVRTTNQDKEFLGCIRRNDYITVLFKQKSDSLPGDFLGRLVIGLEGDQIKVFGDIVIGSTIMPLSERLTLSTSEACFSLDRLR